MFCDFIVFCFCVVFLLARICVEFAVFLGRFLALGVVSFENGFKSLYFSSLFSRFAIFLVLCYFCVVLFSAFFSLKCFIFYFSFFGFGGRFV